VRILHIDKTPCRGGGVGSFLAALTAAQQRRGHHVEWFGCREEAQSSPGPLRKASRPAFVDFTAAGPWALPRMIHNAQAAQDLAAFLRPRRFDVAHLHNIYHHLTPSILPVLARHGAAIVMTIHDYRLACPTKHFLSRQGLCTRCDGGRFYHAAGRRCAGARGAALAVESYVQALGRRYAGRVDLFLCPTQYMRGVLARAGLPPSKLRVVANPIHLDAYADRGEAKGADAIGGCQTASRPPSLLCEAAMPLRCEARAAGTQDALTPNEQQQTDNDQQPTTNNQQPITNNRFDYDFLYLGRLSEEKGPELMLELARLLPAARMAVAGGGPMAGELRRQAQAAGLANLVFAGRLERDEAADLLARSACLVLTSRCMENSPQSMLEAMAAARCVIVPDQPPLWEWVRDGQTGRLFACGDAASLAGVAAEVLADPAGRERMARAGRGLVAARHGADQAAASVDEAYSEARRRCALRW